MSPASAPLTAAQVAELLPGLPGWSCDQGRLVRTWTFPGFVQAIDFVNGIAQLAERDQHHPDIEIRYNRVTLALVTHDSGGITTRDVEMARSISAAVLAP